VIIAAALCPWPPLLVRELTGTDAVVPELRAACDTAVSKMLAAGPEAVVIVGPGPVTRCWPADGVLDVAAFGGGSGARTARPVLPPAAGIGAYLLDRAGYGGPRTIWSVSENDTPQACQRLGGELAATGGDSALLVLGDGSARRSLKAPGRFDERAAAFDAVAERAIRSADLDALLALDPVLARELMSTGRTGWQVLAGALLAQPGQQGDGPVPGAAAFTVDVHYAGDPFGVLYLVANITPSSPVN
jgi:hypothetical protein